MLSPDQPHQFSIALAAPTSGAHGEQAIKLHVPPRAEAEARIPEHLEILCLSVSASGSGRLCTGKGSGMGDHEGVGGESSRGPAPQDSDAQFDDWYRREAPRLASGLAVASGNSDLAADCVAEAFARAYAHWPRVQGMESPTGWVFRVAQNEMRRRLRRHKREAAALGSIRTDSVVELQPGEHELLRVVSSLPERMRIVVALRYVADLPEAEVASIMGITRGGVSSLLVKARQELMHRLGDEVTRDG